jgi:hypothetical protein
VIESRNTVSVSNEPSNPGAETANPS